MHCHVVNQQPTLGGAEVYTLFFTRVLLDLGCEVTLYTHPDARHWQTLSHPQLRIETVADSDALPARLPAQRGWIVTHAPVSAAFADFAAARHLLTGFCHMPLAGRRPGVLMQYHRVFGVSRYVLDTAREAGLTNLDDQPCYGMVDFDRYADPAPGPILPGQLYTWDQRKFRDSAYGFIESATRPLRALLHTPQPFVKRPGRTLGLISGIAPIKQFDLLFRRIAPIIAATSDVSLEIFGWGGYRSVTDLRIALKPLGNRARFWGHQAHPERIYPQLDYVLSGLPEKEALGLNLLEAQALGTPVLAVNAPPFTETVADGASGYLYRDPREDGGEDFRRVFAQALSVRPDPRAATAHLARFSRTTFTARVARMLEDMGRAL
ncbi:MAG TPA: glycosyltransferase [Burkholderiales bacterium]|jgi:glycosyltransferase involved in cell wall biosynthesis